MRFNAMEKTIINDTLQISFPESFYILSEDELNAMRASANGSCIAYRSDELHIVISIGWNNVEGIRSLFSKMITGKDMVKQLENCYRKSQEGYKTMAYPEHNIGGVNAKGLRYAYKAKGIDMTGESYAFKKDQTHYYFHFYYRTDLQDESLETCKSILDSASWKS